MLISITMEKVQQDEQNRKGGSVKIRLHNLLWLVCLVSVTRWLSSFSYITGFKVYEIHTGLLLKAALVANATKTALVYKILTVNTNSCVILYTVCYITQHVWGSVSDCWSADLAVIRDTPLISLILWSALGCLHLKAQPMERCNPVAVSRLTEMGTNFPAN